MRLWLSNGHFDSQISIPLFSEEEDRKEFIDSWLTLMAAAIKVGSKQREAHRQATQDTGSGSGGEGS